VEAWDGRRTAGRLANPQMDHQTPTKPATTPAVRRPNGSCRVVGFLCLALRVAEHALLGLSRFPDQTVRLPGSVQGVPLMRSRLAFPSVSVEP
jgi:hypothetical protein